MKTNSAPLSEEERRKQENNIERMRDACNFNEKSLLLDRVCPVGVLF